MNETITLPETVGPGPTKPEIRAIVRDKLGLRPSDHVVDVGAGSGAMTIEFAQVANRVTAIERDPDRVQAIERNLAANRTDATVEIRSGEAPDQLPERADALFIGGTRRFEEVLDELGEMGVRTVVLNAARIQTTAAAIDGFRARGLLEECLSVQIGRGYDLAGETGFQNDNPVFVIVGSTEESVGAAEESVGSTEEPAGPIEEQTGQTHQHETDMQEDSE